MIKVKVLKSCLFIIIKEVKNILDLNKIYNIDCIQGMKQINNCSVDMIFCDLPYGVTAKNKWDSIIQPKPLWEQYERIIKDNGVIILLVKINLLLK